MKHPLPPKVLSEHLMHILDCEETKSKRFEFDDCEWMQSSILGDDPPLKIVFLTFVPFPLNYLFVQMTTIPC